ncbi:MAG TPA: hypothetical protein DEG69_17005 [Flavobacteriaceae bacterium]|jgi:hypothetical protein|nr:hypothetical protein [Flavobacteriaceae bacterium]
MPKSRHRKDQKRRSLNRTNYIKAQIKKHERQQREEYMKLLEDAKKQRESNSETSQQTSTPEGEVYGVSPNN